MEPGDDSTLSKEPVMSEGKKVNYGLTNRMQILKRTNTEPQTFNAPHALNVANSLIEKNLTKPIKESHVLKESSQEAISSARAFSEYSSSKNCGPMKRNLCGLRDDGPTVQMGQEGNMCGMGNVGPTTQVVQNGNTLISFDQAYSNLNGPRKRKKKAVNGLGWNVENSRSYFDCIDPHYDSRSSKDEGEENYGVIVKKHTEGEDCSSFLGESSSYKSLTDSKVTRCNRGIINSENSEVGMRVWESISNLGVISRVDIGMSVKLVKEMEKRDKEKLIGKEAIIRKYP